MDCGESYIGLSENRFYLLVSHVITIRQRPVEKTCDRRAVWVIVVGNGPTLDVELMRGLRVPLHKRICHGYTAGERVCTRVSA